MTPGWINLRLRTGISVFRPARTGITGWKRKLIEQTRLYSWSPSIPYPRRALFRKSNACCWTKCPLGQDVAYVPFSRPTYYDSVPLLAIDLASTNVLWREPKLTEQATWSYPPPPESGKESFGNIRHRPVAIGAGLLVMPAYSSGAFVLSSQSGEVEKAITLIPSFKSQLSTPMPWQNTHVLAPRADGYVYDIDTANNRWNYRIDCSRAVTLGEMESRVLAGGAASKFESPPNDSLSLAGAFAGDILVQGDGFFIATSEGMLHRMRYN